MKAETYIKSQSECNKWLKQLTEIELKHLEEMHDEYARIQIEKDREYFIEKIAYLEATHPGELVGIRMRYKARPINLD